MKTISEEYILQLSRLHDQKASFGDAKGLKQSEKYIKKYNPESVIDYGCGKGGVTLALQEAYPDMKVVGYDPGILLMRLNPKEHLICLYQQMY